MTLLTTNLLAWFLQVTILAAAAALAAWRWREAQSRLMFWTWALPVAVFLPLAIPRSVPPVEGVPTLINLRAPIVIAPSPAPGLSLSADEILILVLAAGSLWRLLTIVLGIVRLWSWRRHATRIDGPSGAEWYLSNRVRGPVAFGWLRPTILLPADIAALNPDERRAIEEHELLHIERRDWLFVLAEEGIRAALWFHPAVWWMLAQIQLSREQTVDAEAVRRTGSREQYLNALVAIAEQSMGSDLSPAPLFLKKRQLATRVSALLKENHMSHTQKMTRLATGAAALALAGYIAGVSMPMSAQAQSQSDDAGVTVEAGAQVLHRGPVGFTGSRQSGVLMLDAAVDADGEVTDVKILSGPDALRKEAIRSVLGWHYAAGTASPVRVAIRYTPSSLTPPAPPAPSARFGGGLAADWRGTLKDISMRALSAGLQKKITDALPVRVGDAMTLAMTQDAIAKVQQVDHHLLASYRLHPNGSDVSLMIMLQSAAPPPPPPPPPGFAGAAADGTARLRVGGNVQANNLVVKMSPTYPPLAKQARVQGTVSLMTVVNREGRVAEVQAISGPSLLIEPAIEAVSKWIYKPTLLNGKPVEVITQVDLNFTLTE